jgi:ribonuclease J
MLVLYKELAVRAGIPADNILVADIGEVIEISDDRIATTGTVPSGSVLVDGITVGEVTSVVLRDRKRLAGDGVLIAAIVIDRETGELIGGPDLISRGIVDPQVTPVHWNGGQPTGPLMVGWGRAAWRQYRTHGH